MDTVSTLRSNVVRFLENGEPHSALPLTDILCQLDGRSVDLLLLRARTLFEVREFDNVLRTVQTCLKIDEMNIGALHLGMKAAFELGELKQCLLYADVLSKMQKENVLALCYIGKCAELSGETAKAAKNYQMALERDPFCGEAMEALIERHLLDSVDLCEVIDSLNLPQEAEVLRCAYKTRVELFSKVVDGVPHKLLLLQAARREYENNNLRQASSLTTELLQLDPYNRDAICVHLRSLVDIKATPKLFEIAHSLSKNKSRSEIAVYAIGCYYYSLSNYERAGRYFSRASELDSYFAEAWIAYGHCYAKLEEGEQALNVYRRAINFFPGLHKAGIFVGMQYSRIHQWPIAMCFFEDALKKLPHDSFILNEIGVLYMRTQKLQEARHFFTAAYENLPNAENSSEYLDCIVFNLATAHRKSRNYSEALKYYTQYVRCRPNASHGHCALGFTFHLCGNIKAAISHYHLALSIKSDSFCKDMLDRALSTDFSHNVGGDAWISDTHAPSSPAEVSFSTVSRALRSESAVEDSIVGSPRPSVGRSLNF